tara:strand:+ start:319 stop:699 length:381 start_codon:yes stop_codon:yes gene_type:complete
MAAGKYNFLVEQGADHVLTFTYSDNSNVAIPLKDMSIRMAVKDHISDSSYVYAATSDATIDTTFSEHFAIPAQEGETKGQFILTIPSVTTSGFTFNQGVYDLELVENTSVTRLLEGKFKVKPNVTT